MSDIAAQWELVPVNNGRVLASALSQPESGETVVIAMGADGSAFGAGNTGIAFNVTCLGGLSATYVLYRIYVYRY